MAIPIDIGMASGAVGRPLVVNYRCQCGGSLRPDTSYELPVRRLGVDDAGERPEVLQQGSRGLHGDTWGGGKRCFSGAWSCAAEPLRVGRAVSVRGVLSSQGKPVEPVRGAHDVVTHGEAPPHHDHASLLKTLRHSRRKLVHIGCHNGHMAKCRFHCAGERDEFEKRAPTSHFAKAKWQ